MATMTTLPFKYVRPIYVVVSQDLPKLNNLYDMIMKKRNSSSNKALRKTASGRQLIASIVRGLNTHRHGKDDNGNNKPAYRISIDQGQKSLDWRQYPNVKDADSVKLIIEPMVELRWLEKTQGQHGKKMADMFYAPEGSPLRVDWSYEKLDYSPPQVVIKLYDKRDEDDGGYRSPDIARMELPKYKKLLNNHYIPQIEQLSELVNSHSYSLPFEDYQLRRGFVGGLEYRGGRLQASYQLLSEEERLSILIDNKPVSEVDVVSCGMALLHSLAGQPVPDVNDLYGLVESSLSRKELKLLITAICYKGKLNKHRWPSNWKDHTKHPELGPIVDKTNYRQFCQSLLSAYPWLKKFLLETKDVALKVQWLESEAVIKSMFTVLEAGHGCLSVHESLIIPKEAEAIAMAAMTYAFQEVAGVTPKLKIK